MILLLMAALVQDRVLALDQKYDLIGLFDQGVYLAPRFAKGIVFYPDSGDPENLQITDEEDFRFEGFQITPFVYYINRGSALVRFFPASGAMDTVFAAREVSSFGVTEDGETAVADRPNNAIVFLDFRGRPQYTVNQVSVNDLVFSNDTLYALTGKELLVYDRYGNPIRRLEVPEAMDRVRLSDQGIALFSPAGSFYYWYDGGWTKIELPFDISDLAFEGSKMAILGKHGSTLYFYRPADR